MNKKGKPENLRPFKPGQSGNLSGRPKKTPLTDALRELLDDPKVAKRVAQALIYEATAARNVSAFKEIADRTEGKSVARVEVSGQDGGDVKIRVSNDELVATLKRIYNLA